ncbi:MAG: mechanosensitive ion channel [Leptolyngbya sp. SIO4C1]|nr:mechanosensitive ion channel [Leptolyngbya sp. SIO4C1]
MTQLYELMGVRSGLIPADAFLRIAQTDSLTEFTNSFTAQMGAFLPTLIGALLILAIGIVIAFVASWVVSSILKRTSLDDRIAGWISGRSPSDMPTEKWASTAVFWLVILFTLVAVLNTLNLTVVSEPLNDLLSTILEYLPRIAGAALLLAVAWVIATVVKLAVTRGLAQVNLDERISEQTGVDSSGTSFNLSETLANVLYWFVFLLFLPLILSALDLQGLLAPVESLINEFLSAIPQIITAAIIFAIGWLVARIVRGIVTNLLAASGVDNLGRQFGLSTTPSGSGISLSSLTGTVVYVLILIPVAIAALEELNIEAISEPAIDMLNRILFILPQVLAALAVVVVFYFIGRFVADLVSNLLSSVGFDGIFDILGLQELTTSPPPPGPPTGMPTMASTSPTSTPPLAEGEPVTTVQPAPGKSPSEIVGIIALVGIVLFGVVTATEILNFPQLTAIVRAILAISARVLVGVVIFAIGLYAANLVYRLVRNSMSNSSAGTVAQVARIAVIAFVGALALRQIGIAASIVNLAFGLLLGAVAVAIAIAFGLGGRDVAGEQLREWLEQLKR